MSPPLYAPRLAGRQRQEVLSGTAATGAIQSSAAPAWSGVNPLWGHGENQNRHDTLLQHSLRMADAEMARQKRRDEFEQGLESAKFTEAYGHAPGTTPTWGQPQVPPVATIVPGAGQPPVAKTDPYMLGVVQQYNQALGAGNAPMLAQLQPEMNEARLGAQHRAWQSQDAARTVAAAPVPPEAQIVPGLAQPKGYVYQGLAQKGEAEQNRTALGGRRIDVQEEQFAQKMQAQQEVAAAELALKTRKADQSDVHFKLQQQLVRETKGMDLQMRRDVLREAQRQAGEKADAHAERMNYLVQNAKARREAKAEEGLREAYDRAAHRAERAFAPLTWEGMDPQKRAEAVQKEYETEQKFIEGLKGGAKKGGEGLYRDPTSGLPTTHAPTIVPGATGGAARPSLNPSQVARIRAIANDPKDPEQARAKQILQENGL